MVLWGLGIIAGVLPAIGPAIAGGTLATILSSAAAGAAGLGLVGALTGLGMSTEEADYYESEFKAGRYIVTVTADTRYDEAVTTLRRFGADRSSRATGSSAMSSASTSKSAASTSAAACATGTAAGGQKIQVKEEELHVHKQPVQTGAVNVRKEVHTEHKTIEVPVKKRKSSSSADPLPAARRRRPGLGIRKSASPSPKSRSTLRRRRW